MLAAHIVAGILWGLGQGYLYRQFVGFGSGIHLQAVCRVWVRDTYTGSLWSLGQGYLYRQFVGFGVWVRDTITGSLWDWCFGQGYLYRQFVRFGSRIHVPGFAQSLKVCKDL